MPTHKNLEDPATCWWRPTGSSSWSGLLDRVRPHANHW